MTSFYQALSMGIFLGMVAGVSLVSLIICLKEDE